MDFQPPNLFIRGATVGALVRLPVSMTMYKYLTKRYHQAIIDNPDGARRLPPPIYLTTYRYYASREALRALALPGPAPTHVLEVHLAAGAEFQGPAFVSPLSPSGILALPREHRYGNGIEFLLLTPLSDDLLTAPFRVLPLENGGAES